MANYKIEDVEGIGSVKGDKFSAAGVKDTDSLMTKCRIPKERKKLAQKSGLTEPEILKFANMVDLFRIGRVGPEFAELLEAAGVDTVPELARRNAAKLTKVMVDANEKKKLTRRVPSESEVSKWIGQALSLPRMLGY